ncbi:hypothetical protein SAMN04487895_101550 [Paenibacillus sophorae]|uniref:Uncharacterized protein n=1 Tax=Paenibacillus sophorae TaxID=1333845 RepID=A0A1H8GLT3_9BACL|nr:hypothetical protein [Paenibacillus sophorae]QWU14258.1 hypothetical protein KP014_20320 [Paenibacillus sophorae]SEN44447.1 hypothetical protein SAMN04487895_101550 [Paenibacillus sophorae]
MFIFKRKPLKKLDQIIYEYDKEKRPYYQVIYTQRKIALLDLKYWLKTGKDIDQI